MSDTICKDLKVWVTYYLVTFSISLFPTIFNSMIYKVSFKDRRKTRTLMSRRFFHFLMGVTMMETDKLFLSGVPRAVENFLSLVEDSQLGR